MTAPFPDGQGYMDIAWSSLTPAQRRVLITVHIQGQPDGPRNATLRVLRAFTLVTEQGAPTLTERGRDLARWVVQTGRWS